MSTVSASESPVTVVGLGLMGHALAAAFVAKGHPTTVWNRSAGKADDLVAAGATLADSVQAAVEASPLVVVCVSDYDAVHALLDPVGPALAGRTLVNLTTASSSQARDTAEWAAKLDATYLDGAILALPQGIGTDEATLLYAGPKAAFEEHQATLAVLGEAATVYLDEDHGLSALYDMAVLTIMWGVLNSFLHAAALLGTANVKATTFAGMAATAINVTADYVAAYAPQIDAGEYPATDATVNVHVGGMQHLLEESKALGVNAELPRFFLELAGRAVAGGHAEDSYAALIKQFRAPSA
ncbi:NAD(P)-binding domain-containing protein [Actinosynnema sp. NPDC047251]|uniref:NAD-dependent glycerol-3-phosphate dehydrogenase n=1 Tax=Saccharothrix espanaensis (strain ATCC 51144 / DSM 44229 / JCM 9112 / NBRC 15066 / NRRL 15764) TaxID=1179773 RepID=K0K560_SACES|nr:NAD(P)-binding domain-containing protein [Saccharothrix espanaensis]CCH31999.1 NAD-dependent glycerol-3-phosphate dehydrogenase [Saccharothrix espanaensis DSM 44229]